MRSGVLNLFKPKGMTSFDAVAISRKLFNTKKVGHGGTLDPEVAGVLPILIGKATKIADYLHIIPKVYIGELSLGIETDTGDFTGKAVNWGESVLLTREKILELFRKFKGQSMQIPPLVSAKKINGKRLYKYAREGENPEIKPSLIEIYSLELINFTDNTILFKVKCSKGTYIRSLCRDMARYLGTYGYMSYLIRVNSGGFDISESISIDCLRELTEDERYSLLCPIERSIDFLPKLDIGESYYILLKNGGKIEYKDAPREPFLLYAGEFLGMGTSKNGMIHIGKLLGEENDN